jgi:cell division protein FtsW (lipid II flippase)
LIAYRIAQSKSLKSGHQIIGFIPCVLLVVQWVLGYTHHKQYLQKRRRTWITQSHRSLGPILLVAAIINGGIGLKFADATTNIIIAYAILVGIIATIIGIMMILKTRQKKRVTEYTNLAERQFGEVYSSGESADLGDIALKQHASTPAGYQREEYATDNKGPYVDNLPRN